MAAGDRSDGRRCLDSVLGVEGPGWVQWKSAGPGAYMKVNVGSPDRPKWNLWVKDPRGHEGMLASHIHSITTNEDGTVTVHPSIAPNDTNPGGWHGFLKAGIWREV